MFGLDMLKKARTWTSHIESKYADEIKNSIENSTVERNFDKIEILRSLEKRFDKTRVIVTDSTVEQAVLEASKLGKKVCVLNFASYKDPGGRFYDGAMAQEEALCHASTLYPVLRHFTCEYEDRKSRLNNGLYGEDFIYSRDIVFPTEEGDVKVDVLTYAAPNMMRKAKTEEYRKVFTRRMVNAYCYPYLHGAEVLILGAWGCGVFCNSPEFVSEMWNSCVFHLDGSYDTVIHPVPRLGKTGNKNYSVFDRNIKFNREL